MVIDCFQSKHLVGAFSLPDKEEWFSSDSKYVLDCKEYKKCKKRKRTKMLTVEI